MSSDLTSTERGGDSSYDQYTSQSSGLASAPSKSTGQLGTSSDSTADPTAADKKEAGERKAANIRYGQGISEGGMGGTTTDQTRGADVVTSEGEGAREAQGYGGEEGKGESSDSVGA